MFMVAVKSCELLSIDEFLVLESTLLLRSFNVPHLAKSWVTQARDCIVKFYSF